jgi:hypothetical protein
VAGKYKTSLKRKDAFFLNFDGRKLANAIEKAGGNIKPALESASRKSLPIIQAEFKKFMDELRFINGNLPIMLKDPAEEKEQL